MALATAGLAFSLVGGGAALAASSAGGSPSAPTGYALVTTIPLPGPPGHDDWVAYDPSNEKIYVAHHGSNLAVVDTKTDKVIANVESPDLEDANVMTADSRYVYMTAGKANKITVISKGTWKIVGTALTKGPTPDGIWIDPAKSRLYVVSDDANQLEVYDTGNQPSLLATYPLEPVKPKAGPDVGVLVPAKDTLFEQDDSLVLAINPDTGKIVRRLDTELKVAKNGATKGMIYDPKANRLWIAATDKQVWVVDPDTMAKVKVIQATESDDAMAFDSGRRLNYAFGGHGFDVYNADAMEHIAYVNTGSPITHSGTADPMTHQVYAYEGQANVLGVYAKR
ncbi:MAG TPA: hypothetical protein VLM91_13625 [Candidatus Methylomirabilis sp.]|nr:hypothetical protein [Candidatus Methylomirabilis sp.]